MKALLSRARWPHLAGALACLAALAPLVLMVRPQARRAPLEVSYWYWHRPFVLTAGEAAQLRAMGIRQLFVRAATLTGSVRPRPELEQEWRSRADGFAVTLVLNAAPDVVRSLGTADAAGLAAALSSAASTQVRRAAAAGLHVTGVQFDVDCPTRLLAKYADVLRRTRAGLRPAGLSFSVTALPTWLGSSDIGAVAGAVDYLVPQFYEAEIPRRVGECTPVASRSRVLQGIRAAGRLGVPFYAGVPAYGHALVYNCAGELLGAYHDMTVTEALDHPSLRILRQYPADEQGRPATPSSYAGEDVTLLSPRDVRAADPEHALEGRPDHGMGRAPYYLRYQLPSAVLLAQQLAAVRQERPANCRGVILYRFPQPSDASALPLRSAAATLRGERLAPHLRLRIVEAASPWEAIDTGASTGAMPRTVEMELTNDGSASTYVSPDAVFVVLEFDRPGIDRASAGPHQSVRAFCRARGGTMSSSMRRANTLVYRLPSLGAGQTVRLGPIDLRPGGPNEVRVEWSARGAGGFITETGRLPAYRLGG